MSALRHTKAPVPDSTWNILVDATGRKISGRPPRPGDLLARAPLRYIFKGTIPVFAPNHQRTSDENAEQRLGYEIEELVNRRNLEKAVFYLSQTDDGRRLLELAAQKNFAIVFDKRQTEEHAAAGLCDYDKKLIPLHPNTDPVHLSLTLKHELEHMEHISKGLRYDSNHTFQSALIGQRVMEAMARTSEAVFVYANEYGSPGANDHRFIIPGLLAASQEKLPHMADAAHNAREDAAHHRWGQFVEKIFPAFFNESPILEFYDLSLITFLNKALPQLRNGLLDQSKDTITKARQEIFGKKIIGFMREDVWTPATIAGWLGQNGVNLAIETIDFSKAHAAGLGLSTKVNEAYSDLCERLYALDDEVAHPDPTHPSRQKPNPLVLTRPEVGAKKMMRATSQVRKPAKAATFETHVMPFDPERAASSNASASMLSPPVFAQMLHEVMTYDGMRLERDPNRLIAESILYYVERHEKAFSGDVPQEVWATQSLIDAGLRAPIEALPEAYIIHLVARIRYGADHKFEDPKTTWRSELFTAGEIDLLAHWQSLGHHGLNPCSEGSPSSSRPNVYAQEIARAFKITPAEPDTEKSSIDVLTSPRLLAYAEQFRIHNRAAHLGPLEQPLRNVQKWSHEKGLIVLDV